MQIAMMDTYAESIQIKARRTVGDRITLDIKHRSLLNANELSSESERCKRSTRMQRNRAVPIVEEPYYCEYDFRVVVFVHYVDQRHPVRLFMRHGV